MKNSNRNKLNRILMPFKRLRERAVANPQNLAMWLIAWFYCLLVIYLFFGPIFKFASFSCSTSIGQPCPDFVIPEVKKFKGESVLISKFDTLESKIKANIPQAEAVTIKPVWPNQLHVDLLWQRPIANLSIPASNSAYIVSSTNQLMSVVDSPNTDLPLIIASSAADLIISDQLSDPSLIASLDALKLMDKISLEVSRILVMTGQDIRLELKNGYIAIITSTKPVSDQLRALQLILSQSTMNQKLPVIDVRVDRPVLKLTP